MFKNNLTLYIFQHTFFLSIELRENFIFSNDYVSIAKILIKILFLLYTKFLYGYKKKVILFMLIVNYLLT